MIEAKEMLTKMFAEIVSHGKEAYGAVHSNAIVGTAQPIIAALGALCAVISGYEIGHTAVLKGRGLWHPSLQRPVLLLTTAVPLAILSTPQVAAAMATAICVAALLGASRALFEMPRIHPFHDFESFQETYGGMPAGIELVEPSEFLQIAQPTEKDVSGLIWQLTKTACESGDAFTEGCFVVESKQAQEIYTKLQSMEAAYSRRSSHFKGRGDKNHPQMGLDFSAAAALPASKRTILFGLAKTDDDQHVLFIKPENWGADHHLKSLKDTQKLTHFINHSLQFIHAQYVKIMRPGYDDRPGTAKERIPHNWKQVQNHYGWAGLSSDDKIQLIVDGLAKAEWLKDRYRTGREVYISA
jgi:hypothetical protein